MTTNKISLVGRHRKMLFSANCTAINARVKTQTLGQTAGVTH